MEFTKIITWILHESEAFICKALKGEVVVCYFEPLITQQMKASGSPEGWKLRRSTLILFTNLVFGFTAQIPITCCYLILFKCLINFHARFRY